MRGAKGEVRMLMAILCLTPSVAFLLVCLYACIDPDGVEASVDQLMQRWDKHAGKTR